MLAAMLSDNLENLDPYFGLPGMESCGTSRRGVKGT